MPCVKHLHQHQHAQHHSSCIDHVFRHSRGVRSWLAEPCRHCSVKLRANILVPQDAEYVRYPPIRGPPTRLGVLEPGCLGLRHIVCHQYRHSFLHVANTIPVPILSSAVLSADPHGMCIKAPKPPYAVFASQRHTGGRVPSTLRSMEWRRLFSPCWSTPGTLSCRPGKSHSRHPVP